MNGIINSFLLEGDEFIPEMYLGQPELTYSAYHRFDKNKVKKKLKKKQGYSRYIYQNEIEKTCFQHDIAYRDFKDLDRRTVADKVIHDKTFNIAESLKYLGYQGGIR